MTRLTSDASVALTIVAGGLFLGLLTATVFSGLTGARPTRRLVVGCVVVATAAVFFLFWSILGYDAVADRGRLQRAATIAAAASRSAAISSAPVA